jgi:DinB superfamily
MSALSNEFPNPTNAAKEQLLALLRESRERFLASFADVAEESCRCLPSPECWSVLGCVEHVAAAETFMLGLLKGPRRSRSAGAPNREQIFLERVANRSNKVKAPERAHPTGRFPTLDAARKQFETSRAGAILFAEQSTEDLRATEVTHSLFGDVSAHELLIIMAKHAERHALQIEEIRNSPAFVGEAARARSQA